MEATVKSPAEITNSLRSFQMLADYRLRTGSQEECIEAGKRLAGLISDPRYAGMANGIAAILENYREGYKVRFLEKAVKPSPAEARILKAEVGDVRREAIELPLGTFTVVRGTDGAETYETIKLERIEVGPLAGKVIASHISGPDNELDFQGFAFVSETGRVNVWKKNANIDPRWTAAVEFVVNGTRDEQLGMSEAYALRSGRCSRCNRKLTVPASLNRGYGPDCAAILGLI
jgi:hypothetical protein